MTSDNAPSTDDVGLASPDRPVMAASPLHPADAQSWLEEYGRAWREQNVLLLDDLFLDDALYFETPFTPPFDGLCAIKDYWQVGAVQGQRDIEFSGETRAVAGEWAWFHWRARFTRSGTERTAELDGMLQCRFQAGGAFGLLCTELREWWHRRERADGQASDGR